MELYEMVAYRASTACVAIVSFILSYELYRRYRDSHFSGNILLSIYVFSIGITYLTMLLLRPESDADTTVGSVLSYICFASGGSISYFGALFSVNSIKPRHEKVWFTVISMLELAYLIGLFLFPPAVVEVRSGYFEWKASPMLRQFGFDYALATLWLSSVALFVAFTIRVKDKKDRVKSALIATSMALLLFFILICEGVTGWIPVAVRRALTAMAVILLYTGFVMPRWLSRMLGV